MADPSQEARQIWRTDLLSTAPYWEGEILASCRVGIVDNIGWYTDLSSHFLAVKCARLLVLAGQERLDKELMVGQMCVHQCVCLKSS
jgi:protein phosphatase methylesterase 1